MPSSYVKERFGVVEDEFPVPDPADDPTASVSFCPGQAIEGTPVRMRDGPQGREWKVARGVHCFKITIQDDHPLVTIDAAQKLCSRIPLLLVTGLEIVSEEGENGLAFYESLAGGRAGVGGRGYVNVVGPGLGVVLHEIGHAMQQHFQNGRGGNPDFLDEWRRYGMNADSNEVSAYGSLNPSEDCAEYCLCFGVALHRNDLATLKSLSPNRFKMWARVVVDVNTRTRKGRPFQCGVVPAGAARREKESLSYVRSEAGLSDDARTRFLVVVVATTTTTLVVVASLLAARRRSRASQSSD